MSADDLTPPHLGDAESEEARQSREAQQDEALFGELCKLLNGREGRSGTPDHILASMMLASLVNFEMAVNGRDNWWSFQPMIGGSIPAKDQ